METLLGRTRFQGKGLESSVADVEKETSGDNKVRKSLRQMHGQGWRAGARSGVDTQGGSQQPGVVMEDVADFAGRM